MLRAIGRGALEKVAAGLGVGAGRANFQTATRHICSRTVPQLGSLLARKRSFTIGLESAVSVPAFQRPLPISTGLRGIATDASTNEPAEVPKKARKAMTWYGMRISTDPTAPSVIRRRPTTPSQRHTALIDKTYLWRGKPLKALTKGIKSTGGRNNQGVVTVWGKGGGNKRRYRLIDFKRAIFTSKGVVAGTVERIEWDPNRTAMIALLRHKSVEGYTGAQVAAFSYIVCPRGIAVGNELVASRSEPLDVKPGNAMQLRFIPVGTLVHNVEMHPGKGAQFIRSAGTYAQLLEKDEAKGLALLRMQSKEQRYVRISCLATVGEVSNPEHKNQTLGKAGRSRWMGRRSKVRGVAMNPVDHPNGGGEGKKSGKGLSPWGKHSKGFKTVRKVRSFIKLPRWKAKKIVG